MKNNASLVYNACLIVGDFLALVAAFVAAYILRVKLDPAPLLVQIHALTYLGIFLTVLPFWILIFALLGLYDSRIYEQRFKEFGRLLVGSFIGLLVLVFWNFVSKTPIFPARLVPIYGFGFGFAFLVLFRNTARFLRTQLFEYGIGLTKIVIIGNTPMTAEFVNSLANSRRSGYKIMAVIGGKRRIGKHPLLTYATFQQFLQSNPLEFHSIIQTELYADEARNAEILTYAQEHHVGYRFVPGNTELFVGNLEVELFRSGVPVITVHQTALFGWGRIVKRLNDICLGSLLVVLTSPLMLAIATAIKLSDPRAPVLYRAKRLTRFGTTIYVLKFRSMKRAFNNITPEEGFAKLGKPELIKKYRAGGDQLAHDPRISRIGRFIRAASLDELPQLLNVVRGDISLVGPRALDVYEIEQYSKKNLILSVKSGLTSLAVVSGRTGISFEERRKLDLYYAQNWSVWLDIIIVIKTVRVVFGRLTRKGARY